MESVTEPIPSESIHYSSNSSTSSRASARLSTHGSVHSVLDSEYGNRNSSRKPALPYVVGLTITATAHEAPAPFGDGYTTSHPVVQERWKALSQLDLCVSRPSLGGQKQPTIKKSLTITGTIRTGYSRGAQLVVVNNTMVAKIYDPLYYNYVNDFGLKENVIWDADGDYSREVAAYMELQKSLSSIDVTPAYYGSYTMNIKTPIERSGCVETFHRVVPLILIELLHGTTMVDIDPSLLSWDTRTAILKKVIHAESIISHAGVGHDDYSPRNIILLGFDHTSPDLRPADIEANAKVKVIDFNVSEVFLHPNHQYPKRLKIRDEMRRISHPQLPSPIVRYYGKLMEFYGWVSSKDEEAERWLWHQFHNDQRFRPVVWDPESPDDNPRYADETEDDERSSDSGISMELDEREKEKDSSD